jgi:hypothetical protein
MPAGRSVAPSGFEFYRALREGLNLTIIGGDNATETVNAMKLEMRQKLAREPFPEKIRKVGQLIRSTSSRGPDFGSLIPPGKSSPL